MNQIKTDEQIKRNKNQTVYFPPKNSKLLVIKILIIIKIIKMILTIKVTVIIIIMKIIIKCNFFESFFYLS